jgi:hypothetical protein
MADIEVSCKAYQQRINRMVLAHESGWVKYNGKMSEQWTIWDHFMEHPDEEQTKLINQTFFK